MNTIRAAAAIRRARGTSSPTAPRIFADAGERDHQTRVRHRRRNHRDHVGAHAVEVGCRGEAEHHGQAEPGARGPIPQRSHTRVAEQAGEQHNTYENDQRRHGWSPIRCRLAHLCGARAREETKRADPEAAALFFTRRRVTRASRAVRSRSRPRRSAPRPYSTGSTPCEPTASSGSTKYSISRSSSSSSSDGCSTGGGGGGSSAGIVTCR